ncbi:hypothetical protein BH20GEM1_BH20GEM1_13810 [soil metagenome]
MKTQLANLSGISTLAVWSLILGFIALGASCSGDAVTEPEFAKATPMTPRFFLPPGETCQGHPFEVDGGVEQGGLTIYHNPTCSDEFLVYYYYGGQLYTYPGNYSTPSEPSVDTFCSDYPGVNSCQSIGTPVGEDWCLGGHPAYDEPFCYY